MGVENSTGSMGSLEGYWFCSCRKLSGVSGVPGVPCTNFLLKLKVVFFIFFNQIFGCFVRKISKS